MDASTTWYVRTQAISASTAWTLASRWTSAPEGERFLWDPSSQGLHDGWTLLGAGSVATLTAHGAGALHAARREAQALLRVNDVRDEGLEDAPAVAMFGGASFALGAPRAPEWEPFGDARFTLPRWVMGVRGDRAFVRVVETPGPVGLTPQPPLPNGERGSTKSEGSRFSPPLPIWERGPGGEANRAVANERWEAADLSSRDDWRALVTRAVDAIDAGAFEKLVAARRIALHAGAPFAVGEVLQRLRDHDSDRRTTVFAFEREGACFVGATPERLVEVRGMTLLVDALAGSVPRVAGEDRQRAEALLASDKDRREHDHVVRAIRVALSELTTPDGLSIAEQPEVKTLRHLLHLYTPVRATLRRGAHVLDALAALHPTPAVGGVPRAAAVDWITREEPHDRGWYAGPVGWFDAHGDGAFVVALRSALIKDRDALVYAGAGIVRGSDPETEYAETTVKMTPMLSALGVSP